MEKNLEKNIYILILDPTVNFERLYLDYMWTYYMLINKTEWFLMKKKLNHFAVHQNLHNIVNQLYFNLKKSVSSTTYWRDCLFLHCIFLPHLP